MRKAGQRKHRRITLAGFMLCVHLFGMLVTTILHPLYHAHTPHWTCDSAKSVALSESGEYQFLAENDTPPDKMHGGESCLLCLWKVSHEFLSGSFNAPYTLPDLSSSFTEIPAGNYFLDPRNLLFVRGPPVL